MRKTSLDKKKTILEAAKSCFLEKGYYGSGIDEIARRAGVTKSLLYYYFDSKEDIFIDIMEDSLARLLKLNAENTYESLRARFEHMYKSIKSEGEVLSIALVDVFMSAPKSNMIIDLATATLEKTDIKLDDEKKFLFALVILRIISFYSMSDKAADYFNFSFERMEEIYKEELFALYCRIFSEEEV